MMGVIRTTGLFFRLRGIGLVQWETLELGRLFFRLRGTRMVGDGGRMVAEWWEDDGTIVGEWWGMLG